MKRIVLFVIMFGFWLTTSYGQDKSQLVDSLVKALDTAKTVQTKLSIYYEIAWLNRGIDPKLAKEYSQKGLKLARKSKLIKEEADFFKTLGVIEKNLSNYEVALTNMQKALDLYESVKDKPGMASCYGNMGIIHKDMQDLENTILYYEKAMQMYTELKNDGAVAASYSNLGLVYMEHKDLDKSELYLLKALAMCEKLKMEEGKMICRINLGRLNIELEKYSRAYSYLKSAEEFAEQIKDKAEVAIIHQNIAHALHKMGRNKEALPYVLKSREFVSGVKNIKTEKNCYQLMASIYSATGNYNEAFKASQKYIELNELVLSEERIKAVSEMEAKYENTKKEKEILELYHQRKLDEVKTQKIQAESDRKSVVLYSLLAGCIVIFLSGLFVFRAYQQRKRANRILQLQKSQIEKQKEIIEEKQKEIIDSIHYAKRIQEALLPSKKYFTKGLRIKK